MGKVTNRGLYFHVSKPGNTGTRLAAHYVELPGDMSTSKLRNMLCSAGPGLCNTCMLCEYGKEYIQRYNKREANTMYFQISCSNCGHRSQMLPYDGYKTPDRIIKAGWDSFGDAFYCPKCVKTWEKRNGKDRPLWGATHTRDKMQRIMIKELLEHIEYMNTGGLE